MSDRFDSYDAALNYLTESTDYERMRRVRYNADTFNLDRVAALLRAVGHPERQFRSLHIAGTKGKGSTAAMAEAILREHGLRTGLFTSPHLVELRERIQIDRQLVSEDLMRRMIGRVATAVEAECSDQEPTFFEMMTAIAFLCFTESDVDVAVVETGLGGRLDSTNVLEPVATVITSVSIDHTFQLGDDLATIAAEKAGIIKPAAPLVLAPQEAEAERVILDFAATRNAPVIQIGKDVRFDWQKTFLENQPAGRMTIRTPGASYDSLVLPLGGRVQAVNAACAVAAAEVVLAGATDTRKVREGLAGLRWPGRMQALSPAAAPWAADVTVILDGAHNADSLRLLCESVGDYYPDQPVAYIFAAASDKDIPGMMKVLSEARAEVVFTRTDNPRAAEPRELAVALTAAGRHALGSAQSWLDALPVACTSLGDRGVIVICGSLYLVGAVLRKYEQ